MEFLDKIIDKWEYSKDLFLETQEMINSTIFHYINILEIWIVVLPSITIWFIFDWKIGLSTLGFLPFTLFATYTILSHLMNRGDNEKETSKYIFIKDLFHNHIKYCWLSDQNSMIKKLLDQNIGEDSNIFNSEFFRWFIVSLSIAFSICIHLVVSFIILKYSFLTSNSA